MELFRPPAAIGSPRGGFFPEAPSFADFLGCVDKRHTLAMTGGRFLKEGLLRGLAERRVSAGR